jgi:multidrug transporter EmrE-like cation transporter
MDEPKAPMFLASSLAILSAFSVTLSKVVTVLLGKTFSGKNQFSDFSAILMTIVWIIGLILQLILLNIGLQNFEQGVFVPMFETMSASITIIFGVMYFKSYDDFHAPTKVFGFWAGVAILILGLFLTSRRHSPTQEEMLARLNERSPRAARRLLATLEHTSREPLVASRGIYEHEEQQIS